MNLDSINLDALRPLIPLPMVTKLLALLGIVLGICIGYYILFWSPLQESIEGQKTQVEQQRVRLMQNQKLASNIPKKKEEYQMLQRQLKVALNMLPKKSQIPDLLEGVTWAGKDSGLKFAMFRPGAESTKSIYAEVPVSLKVSGSYGQLLTFLKRVGEMPRIVDIKNLKMKSEEKGRVLNIEGSAVTYRFVEAADKKPKNKPRK